MKAIRQVTTIMITDKELITGETPKRIIEYTYHGNLVEPGPETKNVITKSSRDIVIAIKNPERMPGKIAGTTTLNIV